MNCTVLDPQIPLHGPFKNCIFTDSQKAPINKIITLQTCNFTKEMFSTKVFSLKPVSAGIEALPTPIHRVQTLTKDTTGMFLIAASEEIIQIQEYFNKHTVKQYIS